LLRFFVLYLLAAQRVYDNMLDVSAYNYTGLLTDSYCYLNIYTKTQNFILFSNSVIMRNSVTDVTLLLTFSHAARCTFPGYSKLCNTAAVHF